MFNSTYSTSSMSSSADFVQHVPLPDGHVAEIIFRYGGQSWAIVSTRMLGYSGYPQHNPKITELEHKIQNLTEDRNLLMKQYMSFVESIGFANFDNGIFFGGEAGEYYVEYSQFNQNISRIAHVNMTDYAERIYGKGLSGDLSKYFPPIINEWQYGFVISGLLYFILLDYRNSRLYVTKVSPAFEILPDVIETLERQPNNGEFRETINCFKAILAYQIKVLKGEVFSAELSQE